MRDAAGRAQSSLADPAMRTRWHAMLTGVANERGYKPGWIAHKHKEKFGAYPPWGSKPQPIPPTPEVWSWVRSRAIAFARRTGDMSKKDKGRLPPFVPIDQEVMRSPAWRAMSFGARWLYMHLKRRWSFKQRNNGRIFLSQRDAQEEMGAGAHRDSVSRWFRELEHYGFIVMTSPGCLGVDGKGKAPHWRLTELEAPGGRNADTWMLPTKDYLKWEGTKFRDDRGAVKRTREWRQKRRATKSETRPVH